METNLLVGRTRWFENNVCYPLFIICFQFIILYYIYYFDNLNSSVDVDLGG